MIRPLAAKCAPAAMPAARFPRATSPGRRARSSTRTPSQPIAASKASALPPKTAVQSRSAFQSRPWTQPRIAEAITKAAPQSNPAPTIPRAALVSTAAKGDPLTTGGMRIKKARTRGCGSGQGRVTVAPGGLLRDLPHATAGGVGPLVLVPEFAVEERRRAPGALVVRLRAAPVVPGIEIRIRHC